eukprot:COSAG01_NODE_69970_length_260_cov_0.459627_1_plen_34_part_01
MTDERTAWHRVAGKVQFTYSRQVVSPPHVEIAAA